MDSDQPEEVIKLERPKRAVPLTSLAGLLGLFHPGTGSMFRPRSLTAGINKYQRHQGNKEMERRRKNGNT